MVANLAMMLTRSHIILVVVLIHMLTSCELSCDALSCGALTHSGYSAFGGSLWCSLMPNEDPSPVIGSHIYFSCAIEISPLQLSCYVYTLGCVLEMTFSTTMSKIPNSIVWSIFDTWGSNTKTRTGGLMFARQVPFWSMTYAATPYVDFLLDKWFYLFIDHISIYLISPVPFHLFYVCLNA